MKSGLSPRPMKSGWKGLPSTPESFPKKPASGRPPRDKRHRAKERAKKGSFVYNPA
jgi:hypothetical protein